jgi:hypothetical protein
MNTQSTDQGYTSKDILIALHIDDPGADEIQPARNWVGAWLLRDLLNVELGARGLIVSIMAAGELNHARLVIKTSDVAQATKAVRDVLERVGLAHRAVIYIFEERERIFRSIYPNSADTYFTDQLQAELRASLAAYHSILARLRAMTGAPEEINNDANGQ